MLSDYPLVDVEPTSAKGADAETSPADLTMASAIERIVRSSALATECPSSAFYVLSDGGYIRDTFFDGGVELSAAVGSALLAAATASKDNRDRLIRRDL
jgi:hypothetical protein